MIALFCDGHELNAAVQEGEAPASARPHAPRIITKWIVN